MVYICDRSDDRYKYMIDIATWLHYTIYIFEAAAVAQWVGALGWVFESKPRQT